MSLDVLRGVIFGRGGLSIDLFLRLQEASGVEVVTEKELLSAMKSKTDHIKAYIKNHKFDGA